jgi:salicylate hydroxylase
MRVIVVGMGIGGAACTLALQRCGIDVLVLEQAGELSEVGAGLQLSPNALRVLERLGIGDALQACAVEPQAHLFKAWDSGETLLRTPLMPAVRETFAAPYYHAHRADLLALLTGAVEGHRVRLDARVVAVRQTNIEVTVALATGETLTCDVLVGADGIHSLVREHVTTPPPTRNAGCVAWRGLVPVAVAHGLGLERNSYIWMGPDRSVVMYFVRGGELFNWVGIGPNNDNAKESWSAAGSKDLALEEYGGWHPQIRALIDGTDSLFMTSLADREPLANWVNGNIALMGDAAHAMMPFHAQGAAQSIEDAWVLARCLEMGAADVPTALNKYQSLRYERANLVQGQSRAAEHLFHMSAPDEVATRNARFRKMGATSQGGFPSGQRWLFAYDAEKAVLGTDDEWRALRW